MARRSETRDRLIATAAELFWSRGYASTGVNAIMKRARATSGSFYHFFPTKDDLLLAVLDAVAAGVEDDVLAEAERGSDSAQGRITALATAYSERTVPGSGRFGLPIGALVHELGPDLGPARQRVAEIYERVVGRIAAWLAEDAAVEITGIEGRRVAEGIIAAFEGAGMMAAALGSSGPIDATAELVATRLAEAPDRTALINAGRQRSATEAGDWKAW